MPRQVILAPHQSSWAKMFDEEARRIRAILSANALAIHHIGSTAIPGIVAKPIIDMLVAVADLECVDRCNGDMATIGYEAKGAHGIPMRRYFRKENDCGIRTHHVHIYLSSSPEIDRHLAFRDFLNAHPDWANAYSNLKMKLAAKHAYCTQDYQEGKSEFVTSIGQLADSWRRDRGNWESE